MNKEKLLSKRESLISDLEYYQSMFSQIKGKIELIDELLIELEADSVDEELTIE